MKHLKTYRIFEAKFLNPVEKYLLPLYDLGFEEVKQRDYYDRQMEVRNEVPEPGLMEISISINNPTDEFLKEVFDEYLALMDRLKSDFTINYHNIIFNNSGIKISFKRKVTDVEQEIEMDPAQKVAYDALVKSLAQNDESLEVQSMWLRSIKFNKHKVGSSSYEYGFVSIWDDGKVDLPILRGRKSHRRTELPFTEEDIKWFNRINWIDEGNRFLENREEFDRLHEKSQQELREIYK